MDWLKSLLLGIIQGLTEFLPVSSSGHLEIGKVLLGVNTEQNLLFTVLVHGATVLSTIVVFNKELLIIIRGLFSFKWNEETKYSIKIIISMIPVGIVGVFFKDYVESFFTGNLVLVGIMLIVTSILLAVTYYSKVKKRSITYFDSLIIGMSQAFAVIPGISRAGATIATSLLLGNKKEEAAKFSFLMVILPIIGANTVELLSTDITINNSVNISSLVIGFVAAFITGLIACKWMINIVKKGKLTYFAAYCFLVGIGSIIYA